MNKQIDKVPLDTMKALVNWPWPGNVRELENFIERAVILSQGSSLLLLWTKYGPKQSNSRPIAPWSRLKEHVSRVLGETGWVVSQAAARLGMPRTTLNAMMRKLGISRKDA